MEALYKRSCYATTGARIVISFSIAGATMGQELSTKVKPGLGINRYISGTIAGTGPLKKVELIRNGSVIHTWSDIKGPSLEFDFDDNQDPNRFLLDGPAGPFVYYYLRVLQEDKQMAWATPIWIDFADTIKPLPKKKNGKK